MNDYFNFAEILTHTNFLRSDISFVKDGSMITNHTDIINEDSLNPQKEEPKEHFCSNLKFDFEARKWTDNKRGLLIIALSISRTHFLIQFIFSKALTLERIKG